MFERDAQPSSEGQRSFFTMATFWIFSQILGWFGAFLVIYSLVAQASSAWEPLERTAPFLSSALTILGVLVTTAAVYLPPIPYCPPWRMSRWLVAPLVMLGCVVAVYLLVKNGSLPLVLVNGFAMLGLSGGLLRILQIDVRRII